MKKNLFKIIISLMLFVPIYANAASVNLTLSCPSSAEVSKTVSCTVKAKPVGANLKGVQANYQITNGKYISFTPAGGITAYSNSSLGFSIARAKGETTEMTIGTLKLQMPSTGDLTVKLIKAEGSTDTYETLSANSPSKTIKGTLPKSTNNNLASLKVDGKTVSGFSANKTTYNMTVDNGIGSVVVTADPADPKAKVTGTGNKKLVVYKNTVRVVVTAENGSKKTYVINIARKDSDGNTSKPSSNNNLKSLVIAGYDIKFDKNKTNYTLNVPQTVTQVNVTAVAEDDGATVKINNPNVLKLGDNTLTVEVTSQTGVTKTYTVIVNRDNGIPKTTIDKFLETIEKTESDTIIIEIRDDNNTITKEMLDKVKEKNKTLIIRKYVGEELKYAWEVKGKDIKSTKDIDTLVEMKSSSDKKINELTNNGRYIYFKNYLDTSIFSAINFKLYTDNSYNDEAIYGHEYKDEKLTKKYDLKYLDNYIEINNIASGEYVINQMENFKCPNCIIYIIIALIELFVIIALVLLLVLSFKKNGSKIRKK